MKYWKIIFVPFAIIYSVIVFIRNFLYDIQLKKTHEILGKSIVVGNLSMGGTGKSPMILYLWNLLKDQHLVAILSRGYGRKTKGLIEVKSEHVATQVGDEPLMFKRRIGENAQVIVSENREQGVAYIRSKVPSAFILLDDAFQHRKVRAGLSILLTDYRSPYFCDFVFPVGTLRESRRGRTRAHILVLTKCPESLSDDKKQQIRKRSKFFPHENIFFSHVVYGEIRAFGGAKNLHIEKDAVNTILLVAGIAKPQPLLEYLRQFCKVKTLFFPDHHNFSQADIVSILNKFDSFAHDSSVIITTEKDFVRLNDLLTDAQRTKYPWYYQAIEIKIDREKELNTLILKYAQ